MPAGAPRVLWKGAISFGLVHIPVAVHAATRETGLSFDWLDKRSMDPVGYKRINKKTGEEIAKEDIVKGLEHSPGRYVILSDEEIKAALPASTQTIDIESFIAAEDIPLLYFERPYYLAPTGKGEKVYALLRETLTRTRRVGIARVVIQTKQHLAALLPEGPALLMLLLRWPAQIRALDELNLPPVDAQAAAVNERELAMATRLVEDLSGPWRPENFKDSFSEEILALVEEKAQAGSVHTVVQPEPEAAGGAELIDLTELLRRSLRSEPATEAANVKPAGPKVEGSGRKAKTAEPKAKPAARRKAS